LLLHHQIDGHGARVLLLHPVGLDLTAFDALVTEMRGRYQILRVDLRGHGRSPTAAAPLDLADYAADVHETLTALQFAPAAVVGFSFGGMIAQTLVLDHGSDVSALVVGACPATLGDDARAAMIERGAAAERGGMAAVVDSTLQRWFTQSFLDSGAADAIRQRLLQDDERAWAAAWSAIARLDTLPRLHDVVVPTLCLAGEHDVSAPPRVVQAVADAIPRARFGVIEGAPHMLFIERPHDTAAEIVSFLVQTRL
jgi:3-oxoadipate enol-lactonase